MRVFGAGKGNVRFVAYEQEQQRQVCRYREGGVFVRIAEFLFDVAQGGKHIPVRVNAPEIVRRVGGAFLLVMREGVVRHKKLDVFDAEDDEVERVGIRRYLIMRDERIYDEQAVFFNGIRVVFDLKSSSAVENVKDLRERMLMCFRFPVLLVFLVDIVNKIGPYLIERKDGFGINAGIRHCLPVRKYYL